MSFAAQSANFSKKVRRLCRCKYVDGVYSLGILSPDWKASRLSIICHSSLLSTSVHYQALTHGESKKYNIITLASGRCKCIKRGPNPLKPFFLVSGSSSRPTYKEVSCIKSSQTHNIDLGQYNYLVVYFDTMHSNLPGLFIISISSPPVFLVILTSLTPMIIGPYKRGLRREGILESSHFNTQFLLRQVSK